MAAGALQPITPMPAPSGIQPCAIFWAREVARVAVVRSAALTVVLETVHRRPDARAVTTGIDQQEAKTLALVGPDAAPRRIGLLERALARDRSVEVRAFRRERSAEEAATIERTGRTD